MVDTFHRLGLANGDRVGLAGFKTRRELSIAEEDRSEDRHDESVLLFSALCAMRWWPYWKQRQF